MAGLQHNGRQPSQCQSSTVCSDSLATGLHRTYLQATLAEAVERRLLVMVATSGSPGIPEGAANAVTQWALQGRGAHASVTPKPLGEGSMATSALYRNSVQHAGPTPGLITCWATLIVRTIHSCSMVCPVSCSHPPTHPGNTPASIPPVLEALRKRLRAGELEGVMVEVELPAKPVDLQNLGGGGQVRRPGIHAGSLILHQYNCCPAWPSMAPSLPPSL